MYIKTRNRHVYLQLHTEKIHCFLRLSLRSCRCFPTTNNMRRYYPNNGAQKNTRRPADNRRPTSAVASANEAYDQIFPPLSASSTASITDNQTTSTQVYLHRLLVIILFAFRYQGSSTDVYGKRTTKLSCISLDFFLLANSTVGSCVLAQSARPAVPEKKPSPWKKVEGSPAPLSLLSFMPTTRKDSVPDKHQSIHRSTACKHFLFML